MLANELRRKFIDFFVNKHNHKEIPSASLIPENDPTVLFTTAGMHPLVPYLMGEKHPQGTRLVDVQKCVRTDDIEEVGDATHCTFFEMLGNWSLGDYFKEGAIKMSYEFMTVDLDLNPDMLCVTCFEGNEDCPRDDDAAKIWESLGFTQNENAKNNEKRQIFFYPKKDNWWGPAGLTGPCGPDTEMFYFTGENQNNPYYKGGPSDNSEWVEIWNDVFMQYNKKADGTFELLKQQNVDTGMGLERVTAILQGKKSHYETELFEKAKKFLQSIEPKDHNRPNVLFSLKYLEHSRRIILDHIRSVTFIIGDSRGVAPSNTDQGYIVRKLIRRAIRHGNRLGINKNFCANLAKEFIEIYKDAYPELEENKNKIFEELNKEEIKFMQTLEKGEKELEKIIKNFRPDRIDTILNNPLLGKNIIKELENTAKEYLTNDEVIKDLIRNLESIKLQQTNLWKNINPQIAPLTEAIQEANKKRDEFINEAKKQIAPLVEASKKALKNASLNMNTTFNLYQTYGFPLELTKDIARENELQIDEQGFQQALKAHQELSRKGAEQKFSGGLADHSEETTALHTATHLLHKALRNVLGDHVCQKGSNITAERLRFDFNHTAKLTPEELKKVEDIVNEQIKRDLPVSCAELTVEEAKNKGAIGLFEDKYAKLGNKIKVYSVGDFSCEICGGPHVTHTGELQQFKIIKEEAVSSGIRRIKAVIGKYALT